MKYIGFIKNYHPNIKNLKLFKDLNFGITYSDKKEIIKYLEQGTKIAVSMHVIDSLFPTDNNIIGGLIYICDGEWVWPNYLNYYLEHYDIEIDKDFISHIKNSDYKHAKLDNSSLERIMQEFECFIE